MRNKFRFPSHCINHTCRILWNVQTEIPGIAIRSTFIAGFPGETRKDFKGLIKFIKQAEFLNAGFFAYSREEFTPAFKLPNQIDEKEIVSD
jgi:ribosomal protein S12 methylthiotransferase